MSHFATIIDVPQRRLFSFGRCNGHTIGLWEDVRVAADLGRPDLLRESLRGCPGYRGVSPGGERRLWEFMAGRDVGDFLLDTVISKPPYHLESICSKTCWWPYCGDIFSDGPLGLFGYAGYMVLGAGRWPAGVRMGQYAGFLSVAEVRAFARELDAAGRGLSQIDAMRDLQNIVTHMPEDEFRDLLSYAERGPGGDDHANDT